jgi:hypothetical protein
VSLKDRLFRGGLPPALLAEAKAPAFYREWMDSFFARDIQRLFGFRDINAAEDLRDVDVIECKWDPALFDAGALRVFRDYYPKGRNYLVTRRATRRTPGGSARWTCACAPRRSCTHSSP